MLYDKLKELAFNNRFMFRVFLPLYRVVFELVTNFTDIILLFLRKVRVYKGRNYKQIEGFKDKYNGKRCFIIGNGPSLDTKDLDKISNEYSFASNKIYLLYENTKWRPTFTFFQDRDVVDGQENCINNFDLGQKFVSTQIINANLNIQNAIHYYVNRMRYPCFKPKYSKNVSKLVEEGYTVTYSMIQFATYMGFKEIYLLGCDFSYSLYRDINGNVVSTSEGAKDHFTEDYTVNPRDVPDLGYNLLAFKKAAEYAKENGIKIFNATRGGKLEAFERVDLDKVVERFKESI